MNLNYPKKRLYIINLDRLQVGGYSMKLLSPRDVAEVTGLPYRKALLIVKSANHIQIGNCYYITERALAALLNPSTAILIEEDK